MNRPIIIVCTVLLTLFFASICVAEQNHQTLYGSKYKAEIDFEHTLGYLKVKGDITSGKECEKLQFFIRFSYPHPHQGATIDFTLDSYYDPEFGSYFETSEKVGIVGSSNPEKWFASSINFNCKKI